jgi:LuxR family quorum sensing-dependent transcriptional regulator
LHALNLALNNVLARDRMQKLDQVDKYWAARALTFVEAAEAAHTPDQVLKVFGHEIARVGFYAHLMIVLDSREFSRRVLANGWHPEWTAVYTKEKMADDDPVPRQTLRSINPFLWREAPYDSEAEPRALTVMRRAVDFGMTEGLCVPIHHGDGSVAGVSIAGNRPDLGHGVRAALHLMSLAAHNRVRGLLRLGPTVQHALTPREREVLRWMAVGKTAWEIGEILDIAEVTVNTHISAAQRKLNAVNRASTIVNAIRAGEVSLSDL